MQSLGPRSTVEDFFAAVAEGMRTRPDCPKDCKQPDGILEELEMDVFKDATGPSHLFQMSRGTPLGVSLGQRVYEPDHPYIKDAPLRNQITSSHPDFASGKLKWREHAGVLHLGGQLAAFFPVVSFYGGSFGPAVGFSGDIILRYRVLKPQVDEAEPSAILPFTPKMALEMPAGSEVEIIGLAALGVSLALAVTEGIAQSPAMIGVTAFVNAGVAGACELGVCVTALEEKGKVRVTHRRLTKKESSVGIGATGGVMFQLGSIWASRIGTNTSILPNTQTTTAYLNSLTSTTTGNFSASLSTNQSDTIVSCIDLDLNDPDAQRIYTMLLLLPLSYGLQEARLHPACAKIAVAEEHSRGNSQSASTRLFGQTLLENSTKQQETQGDFSLPSGEHVSYTDALLTKTQSCWVVGARDIKWEEVRAQDELSGAHKSYLRFRYEDKDFCYNTKRLRKFLRFLLTIGVDPFTFIGGEVPRLKALATRLSRSSKVEVRMDLYVAPEGIDRITNASLEDLQNAYLQASQQACPDYVGAPFLSDELADVASREWIAKFDSRLKTHRFDIFGISPSINECYKKYTALKGRSLSMDYGLLKQAEQFAQLVKGEGPEKFFLALGKQKGFDYQQSIAALMLLAGPENTRISDLSLTSGSIKCSATPQTNIAHPQEGFAAHTVSVSKGHLDHRDDLG